MSLLILYIALGIAGGYSLATLFFTGCAMIGLSDAVMDGWQCIARAFYYGIRWPSLLVSAIRYFIR